MNCVAHIPKLVTDANNIRLMDSVSEEEIKSAVFSVGSLKAPGPNGLNGLFYQQNWNLVKNQVCNAVLEFFNNGCLPSEVNEIVVALTSKATNPEYISNLRPISCCNFIYKVISRVIVIRLKPIMEGLISPQQSAFVGGRIIQDNIVVAHENAAVLKLNMNKVYDRVEWAFLKSSLLLVSMKTR